MTQLTFEDMEDGKRKEIKIDIPDGEREIELNGVKTTVKLEKDYLGHAKKFFNGEFYCPHLEIQSEGKYPNRKKNILTDTGYRSYFFDFWILEESKTYEEVVEKILKADNKWVEIKWL